MNTKQCWHVPEAKRRLGWISVFLISTLCLDTLACRNSSNNPQATGDAAVTTSSETKETASSSLPNVAVPDDDNNRPKTVEEVVRQVENGVVLFKTFNSQGKPLGSGTGFALDSSGRIATNFHIFRYAHSATVEFHDKSTARVDGLVAWDVQSDLAIAQLESATHPLTALRLSESTDRPNGMSVIAIGHPQGLKFTTTTGILSAAHQTSELPNPIRQAMRSPDTNIWLQTTAVIDGGSSGGPLLDGTGSVIGINTMTNRRFSFSVDVRHLRQL
jgi:S1-C subfamily serine protease